MQHIESSPFFAVYPAKRSASEMDMAGNPIATLGGIPNNLNVGGGSDVVVETIEVPDNTVGLGIFIYLFNGRL